MILLGNKFYGIPCNDMAHGLKLKKPCPEPVVWPTAGLKKIFARRTGDKVITRTLKGRMD